LNKREKRLENEKKRIVYLCLYEENSMNENEKDKIYERKGSKQGSETERNGEREESSEENELEKRDGEKGRW